MTTISTIIKKALNVKDVKVLGFELLPYDETGQEDLIIYLEPYKSRADICPHCHKACPYYDKGGSEPCVWRDLDWGATTVKIYGFTHRIRCPEHGIVTAEVPWAHPNCFFTKQFDYNVTWMAMQESKTAIAKYMRITWSTVGRCITRALNALEPDQTRRYDNLVHIGIDETSYKKGHKYITVIVNHDTNEVIWVHEDHGKDILDIFFSQLTNKQKQSIKVVSADGAQWITDCVKRHLPNAKRTMDFFHVVQWANAAVDEVRKEIWREVYQEAKKLLDDYAGPRGRAGANYPEWQKIKELEDQARKVKRSTYALGKAPERLTSHQEAKLEYIAKTHSKLYRTYKLKEELRVLLKITEPDIAEQELRKWLWHASHSRIPQMQEVAKKIKKNKMFIINAFEERVSNARIEATNNIIKLIIRKSFGFSKVQNLIDLVMLTCSNIRVPLAYER